MPRVTHLLFLAAFIYADYLCFIQDSSAVFVLASRGMAVSLFFPAVFCLRIIFIHTGKHIVSAPVSCFSADALWHHGTVRWVEFPQFKLHLNVKTGSCPSACQ